MISSGNSTMTSFSGVIPLLVRKGDKITVQFYQSYKMNAVRLYLLTN